MNEEDLIRSLAVALAIGLLVGAERHWRERDDAPGRRTAGVRTFALVGLSGGIVAALAAPLGPTGGAVLLAAGLFALMAALLPFALREAEAEDRFSATSLVAAIGTYALGALAVAGEARAAGAAAVAMTAVLAAREQLHGLMARITWAELRSAILLLSMTLVALPLVPDAPIPWLAGINPHKVWTLAILLAGISFLGYLAVKLGGGQRGLLLAGAAGGLVSSTAVTLSNAAAAARDGPAAALAAGALVAGAVSCLRTAGLALLVAPEIGRALWPALLAAAAGMGVVALLLARRRAAAGDTPAAPANPFEIGAVLRMALLLGGVGALAKFGAEWLGGRAVILIAAVTGLTDVDAITLSVPALVPATITAAVAAQAVAVAVATNILAKAGYALALGSARFGVLFGLGSAAGLGAGAAIMVAALR
ncbi:DUF4010 domain-containing protein [Roseomonas sp. CECT 9278]|uniref:MgtC/SapB family protein n=1 Tax=Roseomonas sp. CECT 9278 TaxID=2845823 RepID=UPI001E361DFA|nr:DUF4010 domain-containing protein [Roseomonas sp. CECT 9278]CAH0289176.1 hypothetical protein ROS9278_04176 [Roseomonas sp. CECT 9278]